MTCVLQRASQVESSRERDALVRLIAALACMGALIHIGAAVDHAAESRLYAAAFVSPAALQLGWAAALLRPRASDRVLLGGCAVNLAALAVWGVSRITGVPFGANPWVPEQAGVADLIESAGELVLVLSALSIVLAPRARFALAFSRRAAIPTVAMLALSCLYGVGAHAG